VSCQNGGFTFGVILYINF